MTYSNGRVLDYNYSSGLNDSISRLSSLSDTSATLESLDYLGLGTVVRRAHPQPGVDLTYVKLSGEATGDAGDQYVGTDRFGRVVDQRWLKTSTSVSTDRFGYGYDRNSNRLWRDNLVNAAFGELYAYDSLDQLTSFQRGTLNATKTGLVGLPSRNQAWNHDALGNFDSVLEEDVVLTRTHNRQNEITSIAGATAPTYDANGNRTTDQASRTFVFDAWDRLVRGKDSGGVTLVSYAHDALGRRTTETKSGTTTDLYYSSAWQVLEERVGGQAKVQYVWSPVYVDALVLRDRDTDGNGSLEERLYVQQDANFNVTALIDASGNVVERYANLPFGAVTIYDAAFNARAVSDYDWEHFHQGLAYEVTVDLYQARRREYSPSLGAWAELDPIGFGGGDPSLYRYEGNGPTVGLDPSGLFDLFKDVRAPEPGENVGDAAMELDAIMTRRSRMAAQGQTPPPLIAGGAPVYGLDGNQNAAAAMVQAGQLTRGMGRQVMTPFYFTLVAPIAIGLGVGDDLVSGNYGRAAATLAIPVIPAGLRALPYMARGARACAGRLGGKLYGRWFGRAFNRLDDTAAHGAAPRVGSTGIDVAPAEGIRFIRRGEHVDDLIAELAQRTYSSGGKEHAIISMIDGSRAIVRGGPGGIDFSTFRHVLRRVIVHTHPRPTGPSPFDFNMLRQLGQRSSWIYELFGGGLTKFAR